MLTIVRQVKKSVQETSKIADALEIVLNRGRFYLKVITFSRSGPPESLTNDGKCLHSFFISIKLIRILKLRY